MRVLLISPHTDDAELGAGGTLLKLLSENHEIFWVVFSTARHSLPEGKEDILKTEFMHVIKRLSIPERNVFINDYRVRMLHAHRQEILEELVKLRKDLEPHLVIGPSIHDYHQDHQVVANEMIRAFKNSASIISYELPWNHVRFDSQLFVKLTKGFIEGKINLLKEYKSQVEMQRPYFDADFIRGWARMRGVQVNAEYAEAYEVIRWIL